MRDLVFYSLEPWDEIWRRNQFFVDLLVKRDPAIRILFIAPAAVLGKRRTRLPDTAGPLAMPRKLAGYDRVYLAQPLQMPLDSRRPVRWVNDWAQRCALSLWTRRLGMRKPVLWINAHRRAPLALGSRWPVVYDITDDWIAALPPSPQRDLVAADDAALCQHADATIVCSARLAELKRPLVSTPARLFTIANGVHVSHYAEVRERAASQPPIATDWQRPVFGYTGTLHDERIDAALVEAVARRMPAGSLVFVGPNHLSAQSQRALQATGRVHFVGPVSYQKIPQYMRAMDAMIVPHRCTAFVESLNPIKLWEYLAAGLPIVATPVAGFRDFPEVVHLASGAEDFARAMQAALGESPELIAQRQRLARPHGWESRVAQVEAILNPLWPNVESAVATNAVPSWRGA